MIVAGQSYQEVRLGKPMQCLHSATAYMNTLTPGGQCTVKSDTQLDGHGA